MERNVNEEVCLTLRAEMGDNHPAVAYDETGGESDEKQERVNSHVCYPINSMVLGKDIKEGDRQGTGIGSADDPCPTLGTSQHHAVAEVISIDGDKMGKRERKGGSGFGINEENVMYTQTVKDVHAVAYDDVKSINMNMRGEVRENQASSPVTCGGVVPGQGYAAARIGTVVRRLVPLECERLMGFPDGWTLIDWQGNGIEECPDSPRYKACGNSFCANCVEWIGRRIEMIEGEIMEGPGNEADGRM